MKFIRFILFIPMLVIAFPAILIIAVMVILSDTREAPMVNVMRFEMGRYGVGSGIERFMQKVFIPTFRYTIQAFVLGGAGFLVITVGLRGLGVLPLELVYFSLSLEFTMLMLWAITVYYTPNEVEGISKTEERIPPVKPPERDPELVKALTVVSAQFEQLGLRIASLELKLAQMGVLEGSMHGLASRLDVVTSEEFVLRFRKEFEQFGALDGSLKALASRFDILVSDQLNLRVKQEFESLLTELTDRTRGNGRTRE